MAIFCRTAGFKRRTFDSSGFSVEGDLSSASAVAHMTTGSWGEDMDTMT